MHTDFPVQPYHRHAVVIGASLAGLLAARVLARYFDRVTIIERDRLGDDSAPRRGVPQGRHAHVMLIRGEQILRSLFPDLMPDLSAAGAPRLRAGQDLRWYQFNLWKAQFATDLAATICSRPLLEYEIRRRVLARQNVRIRDGLVVTRFAADSTFTRITGVHTRERFSGAAEIEPERLLQADLVVDASGRGSQTPQRLQALGFEAPEESQVKVDFGYASRIYARPEGGREWSKDSDWQALYITQRPPQRRGGIVFPIEGNRWLVTLLGWHGDHPPTTELGFTEFARSLPVLDLHAAILRARPLTEIVGHGFPANWRRHYERLYRFPGGLIVMGDALCSFNPVYGQGMAIAAIEAQLLDECLRQDAAKRRSNINAVAQTFQRRAARAVDASWELATSEDMRFPETPGKRTLKGRFLHWYIGKLHEAAGESPLVAERFQRVVNMIAPRSTLFGREVMLEVLRAARRRQRLSAEAARIQTELASGRRLG